MIINCPEKFAHKGHEIFLSGLPIALHCHHYNMNLQKTLESSLGSDGTLLLYEAAELSAPTVTTLLAGWPNSVQGKTREVSLPEAGLPVLLR